MHAQRCWMKPRRRGCTIGIFVIWLDRTDLISKTVSKILNTLICKLLWNKVIGTRLEGGVIWCVLWVRSVIHVLLLSWRRHQIETISALLANCVGNSLATDEAPPQRPVTRSFDFFICAWINAWVNNRGTSDLRRRRAHNDVILKEYITWPGVCLPISFLSALWCCIWLRHMES